MSTAVREIRRMRVNPKRLRSTSTTNNSQQIVSKQSDLRNTINIPIDIYLWF